nr:6953_t:CDS:10 [Entrophospora candida]
MYRRRAAVTHKLLIKRINNNPILPRLPLIQDSLKHCSITTASSSQQQNDIFAFNKLLYDCAISKQPDEAEKVIEMMKNANVFPTLHTYEHLLNLYANVAYASNKKTVDAFEVLNDLKNTGNIPNQYCADTGDYNRAWSIFERLCSEIGEPDKQKDAGKALQLYDEMLEKKLQPTNITYNSLIHALEEMENHGCVPDLITYNTLIYACAINGDLEMARNILINLIQSAKENSLLIPDDITFVNLLWTYASHSSIPKLGIELNGWMFLILLSGCYRHKQLEKAWNLWNNWSCWQEAETSKISKKFDNVYQQEIELEKIGLSKELEYEIYKFMINILARCNDINTSTILLKQLSIRHVIKFQENCRLLIDRIEESKRLSDYNTAKLYREEVIKLITKIHPKKKKPLPKLQSKNVQ